MMTKSSAESLPDVPLVGVAGWFVFLWGVRHLLPEAWKAPWSFDGWVSPVLSAASWFVGGLATIGFVMIYLTEERKPLFMMPLELLRVMTGWGLVFVALVAALHFVSVQSIPASVAADAPLKAQIEKFRERQQKLGVLISDLEEERLAVVGRIRGRNAQAIHGHEILEIDRSLKQLKDDAKEVALTVTKGEVLLRQTERQRRLRDAEIDSNDLAELRVEIEEKLRSGDEPRSAGELDLQVKSPTAWRWAGRGANETDRHSMSPPRWPFVNRLAFRYECATLRADQHDRHAIRHPGRGRQSPE